MTSDERRQEVNFDGLVGPTHNYAGLSRGNLASDRHRGRVSNPKAAAKQGLRKMGHLHDLGVCQAVLPPHPRPDVETLRRCGFTGTNERVVRDAARLAPELLGRCSSASAMWTANAATVAPSADTADGRVHFVPANLVQMFHRAIETATTTRVLSAIFDDARRFRVHAPLPSHSDLGDEGAANHTRLETESGTAHIFCWGRSPTSSAHPTLHPARQTLEASTAVARCLDVKADLALFCQQDPRGIDQGAFHSDVLMVGHGRFLMLHELALRHHDRVLDALRQALGSNLRVVVATEQELPAATAVRTYPFNSQIVTGADGRMLIVAPTECEEDPQTRAFLNRVVSEENPVTRVDYIDVRQSMSNGGGPACLRLRVVLEQAERDSVDANVFVDLALASALDAWIERHYRDRVSFDDLCDPKLLRECETALDELSSLLRLGSIYDFQR